MCQVVVSANEAKCLVAIIMSRDDEVKCLATFRVVLASRALCCSAMRVDLTALIKQ